MEEGDWKAGIETMLKEIDRVGRMLPSLSPQESRMLYQDAVEPLLYKLKRSEYGHYHNIQVYVGQLRGPLELLARKRKGSSRTQEEHICAMIAAINKLRSPHGFDLHR
jgi:hypothetical protein